VAWLGDKDGFERFQAGQTASATRFNRMTLIGPDISSAKIVLDHLARFQEVLEDPNVVHVGDFFTLLMSENRVFRQPGVATLYFDAEAKLLGPNGVPLLGASGENRAYSFSIWSPKNQMTSAAAFVFPEAGKCFVFHSSSAAFADQCTVFDDLRGNDLAAAIKSRLGIEFDVIEVAHQKPATD
jgi:hypothetical protein